LKPKLFFKSFLFVAIGLIYYPIAFAQKPVATGLIAHYCFDGNADDAVGTKHCTVYGASLTTDRNGIANSAYSFDGIDDYIQIPPAIWFNGDFTISGWIYVSSYKDFARFFEFGLGQDGVFETELVVYSPTPRAYIGDAYIVHRLGCGGYTYKSANGPAFPLGAWKFVTIVQKGSTATVWLDGVNVTIRSHVPMETPCPVMRTHNYFGKSSWVSYGDEYFHGKMDDIRIYNRALSALEIDTLYKINQTCQQQTGIAHNNSPIDFYLSQNVPNPSDNGTIIHYKLPQGAEQATIQIMDITGKKVATYPLHNSEGKIEVNSETYHSGLYFYSLFVDGKVLGRKKMMVQKF